MRIGWITSSYGRLINFLFHVVILSNRPDNLKNITHLDFYKTIRQMKGTVWIFLDRERFPFVHQLLKERITIKESRFLFFIYKSLSRFELGSSLTISTDFINRQDTHLLEEERHDFTDIRKSICSNVNSQIGEKSNLPDVLWRKNLIMLCIRDGIWSRDMGHSYTDILSNRNSILDSYIEAVSSLCDLGEMVVRGGRSTSAFNYIHDNFLDYASSNFANDLLDANLWMNTKFAISTGFGADEWSWLFKTPILYTNFGENVNRDQRGYLDIKRAYLPKVVTWRKSNKKLSLDELFDIGYFETGKGYNDLTLSDLDIQVVENKSDVVRDAVLDFREWLDLDQSDTFIAIHGRLISKRWENLNSNS